MAIGSCLPATLIWVLRYAASGFDFATIFQDISAWRFVMMIFVIPILWAGIALLISHDYRRASITITEDTIHGLGVMGLKNAIPFYDITEVAHFKNNIRKAIVVSSNNYGQIYISAKTQRLPELLDLLERYIPCQPKEKHDAEQGATSNR